jgi:hypothetical protein
MAPASTVAASKSANPALNASFRIEGRIDT